MNTRAAIMSLRPRSGVRAECDHEAGFTMVEIAIALGVIAFALVAIIGILPAGLQVQKDNREETIINQDARVLLEAIKSGCRDVTSDLGAFVTDVDQTNYSAPNPPLSTANLIQLLSDTTTNHTIIFNAMSGGIASRGSELGFRYQVVNHVINATGDTNLLPQRRLFGGVGEFMFSGLTNQIHDVRLRFAWPVKADGKLGSEANRYVARTLIAGWHTNGVMYGQQYYNPEP